MADERHARVRAIFAEVVDLPAPERERRLAELCADDAALAGEVRGLLGEDADPAIDFETAGAHAAFHGEPGDDPAASDGAVSALGRVGEYRLLRILGEGGMGVVYLAEQDAPRRTVALKLVRPGLATPTLLRRFRVETEVLGRLQHPGIAQIFAAGSAATDDGLEQPYFAMEYVEGPTLLDFARAHVLSVRDRVRLLVEICRAVQHAHQNGVVHRDLKPSNILVTPAGADGTAAGTGTTAGTRAGTRPGTVLPGRPRIVDFGVARALDDGAASATMSGELVGTLAYMSPEQCRRGAPVDARTDVHALGVVAYELLAGRLPIDVRDDALLDAAARIASETPPRLGTLDPALRGDLETIVAKAMEKDPDRRYASASELAADLERALHDEPVLARPPGTVYQLRKFARRHRGLVAATAIVATTIVGGAAASGAGWLTARAEARRAERDATTTRAVNDFLDRMLASADPERRANPDLRVRDLLEEASTRLDESFPERPLVRADLHLTIGRTYSGLGLMDDAERHLAAALALRERGLRENEAAGDAPDELAEVLHALVIARKQADRPAEALEACDRLLALERRRRTPDDPGLLDVEGQRAILLSALARYDEAEAAFADLLPRWRTAEPGGSGDFATAMNEYGVFLSDVERREEAIAALLEAARLHREHHGPESMGVGLAEVNLAAAYEALGRTDEALAALARGRAVYEARLAPDHPRIATVWHMESMIRRSRGELREASDAVANAIAVQRAVTPDGDVSLALSLKTLGDLLEDQGRNEEALAAYLEVLAILERDLGPVSPGAAATLNSLSNVQARLGRMDDARATLERAIAMITELRGDASPELAAMRNGLGRLQLRAGAYEEALATFRGARAMWAEHQPGNVVNLAFFDQNASVALARLGRWDEAREAVHAALAIRREHLPPGHPSLAASLVQLAEVEREAGALGAAEVAVVEALAIDEAAFDGPHRATARALLTLGRVRTDAGAYAEADATLERAEAMLEAIDADPTPATLERIACRVGLGDPEAAAEALDERWPDLDRADRARATEIARMLADVFAARGDGDAAADWRARADESLD